MCTGIQGFWSDAHRPANAKWHLANYKSEQSEQYERSSRRERSEFTTAGGLGGAVSPPMGSRGEAPENFAFFTTCGNQKGESGQVLTLIIFLL